MIDFNRMPWIYWSDLTKINFLQRFVIIHSLIYYELNESVISDKDFDDVSRYLVELQKKVSDDELKKTQYFYCMKDFDGTTGFYIKDKLNKKDKEILKHLANVVLNLSKRNNKSD